MLKPFSQEAQTSAQISLGQLELDILSYSEQERYEVERIRTMLRQQIELYSSSAQLAIIAVGLEVAISRGQ